RPKSLPKQAARKIARKRNGMAGRQAAELERYRLALDNIGDGVVLADNNLDLKFANRRFVEVLQLPPEIASAGRGYDILRFQAKRGDFGPVESEKDLERIVQERAARLRMPTILATNGARAMAGTLKLASGNWPTGACLDSIATSRRARSAKRRWRPQRKRPKPRAMKPN